MLACTCEDYVKIAFAFWREGAYSDARRDVCSNKNNALRRYITLKTLLTLKIRGNHA